MPDAVPVIQTSVCIVQAVKKLEGKVHCVEMEIRVAVLSSLAWINIVIM